jgi:sodium/bile acid cotransporter 7
MQKIKALLDRLRIDTYILLLIGMVLLATVLPCRGVAATLMGYVTNFAIGLLFFLYGARLSSETVIQGLTNWRLQVAVLLSTFLLFPILGLVLRQLATPILGSDLAFGIAFLCLLPSTVQSSIAFTSIARGNVAAALCCASISNLLGVIVTPILVGLFLTAQTGGISGDSIRDIVLQLLVPFGIGQVLRPWLKAPLARHKQVVGYVDRGSILLVVYTAFSGGVVNGIWSRLDPAKLLLLLIFNLILLAIVLIITTWSSRRLGFSKEDEIAIVFCGSKKSLASGIPIANVLFPASAVSLVVLPLMLFHQIQLMACAAIARRYATRSEITGDGG